MPMVLEAWPGGRWFRDLGDDNGHFWGHVQAIKRPTLLEITGPLMMSFAVAVERPVPPQGSRWRNPDHASSHGTRLFPDGYREGLSQGWPLLLERIRRRVEAA